MKKYFKRSYFFHLLIPIVFFIFGILNIGRDLFGIGHEEWHYAGDLVDTRFNNLILENNYQFLTGEREYLFSQPFFYPAANVLAGSDAHLSTSVFYAFFRMIGFDFFDSFQLWVLMLLALNFFCSYFVFRKFGFELVVAAFGAFMFAFSMPIMSQTFHIQTLCKFPVPFVIYYGFQWFEQFDLKSFRGLVISFVVLFFTSIYFTLFAIIALFVLFILMWFHSGISAYFNKLKTIFIRRNLLLHIAYVLAAFLLCLPFVLKYKTSIEHVLPLSEQEILNRLPELKDYFTTVTGSYWWGELSYYLQQERYCRLLSAEYGTGYLAMIIFFVGMFFMRKRIPKLLIAALTFILITLIATNYNGFSPYLYIFKLPVFDHLQSPWRFYLLVLFFFIIVICYVLNYWHQKGRYFKVISISLISLIMLENLVIHGTMKHDKMSKIKFAHLELEKLIRHQMKPQHTCFVLIAPENGEVSFEQIVSGMYLAYQLNLPCLNGYTTMAPKNYRIDWTKPKSEQVDDWMKYNGWTEDQIKTKVLFVSFP